MPFHLLSLFFIHNYQAQMTTTKTVTVHDCSGVAPPPATPEHRLPLTYFDMLWLYFHPIQRLLFYSHPCSTDSFLNEVIPNLKLSLSKTLAHYHPLAGNLIFPRSSNKPELRYFPGDSVPVTVAESNPGDFDFNSLTSNQPQISNELRFFVPDLPDPKSESGFDKIPLLAIQITLFPEKGISIGITNHHAVGDASSIVGFIKTWCSLSKLGENGNGAAPVYDRSLIKDPSGRADIYWKHMRASPVGWSVRKPPPNRVRATFILRKNEIDELRNSALARNPGSTHLSSFTVSTAYVWACLAKSAGPAGEIVDDNEPEYFGFAVDARHRLEPPVPAEYFGNCIAFVVAEIPHGVLRGGDGYFEAAEAIGGLIANKVNRKEELLKDADEWLVKYGPLAGKRVVGVAGSPKFDLYGADFGWGEPRKYESVSIDMGASMSLCKSREFEGGLEIGLSMVGEKMDAFSAFFSEGLSTSRMLSVG